MQKYIYGEADTNGSFAARTRAQRAVGQDILVMAGASAGGPEVAEQGCEARMWLSHGIRDLFHGFYYCHKLPKYLFTYVFP